MTGTARADAQETESGRAAPWVTVLAGGVGSRFWPASTPARPKQLLPLASDRPLIVDTLERAHALTPSDRVRVLAGAHLVEPFRSAVPSLGEAHFLVEPAQRGTGPVLAWAAWRLLQADSEAVLVSLHADHRITPVDAFAETVRAALRGAREEGWLFTVAVPPTRPETGYGYIRPGAPLEGEDGAPACFRVGAFHEKPDPETAARFVDDGYLWNTGIFVWRADTFLDEVRAHAHEIAPHLHLLEAGDEAGFFAEVEPVAVDVAVLERSDRVAAVRATFGWDDVGSWEALARTRPADPQGNVGVGAVHAHDAARNIVYADQGDVVLFGVDDLVVVRAGGVTLVTDRRHAPDLKGLVERLPEHLRSGGAAAGSARGPAGHPTSAEDP
ncbi:MAG: mannose-1-phosphate guanyltransferase [Gemmatimonadetes bacterium]|nr:MAG: mannose-1-phosphate guanyltransferase [Gemmatimonadota bacterium]